MMQVCYVLCTAHGRLIIVRVHRQYDKVKRLVLAAYNK